MDHRGIRGIAEEQGGVGGAIAAHIRQQGGQAHHIQIAAPPAGARIQVIARDFEFHAPHRYKHGTGIGGGAVVPKQASARPQIVKQEGAAQRQDDKRQHKRDQPSRMLVDFRLFTGLAHVSPRI